jgi:Cu+-exporting ATPase
MSCVGRVEKALKSAQGVRLVTVQLKPGEATVEYDPAAIDVAKLCEVIRKQGYEAAEATGV